MVNEVHSLQDRAKSAEKIIRNPRKYKICLGCESIVSADISTCPNCHAYRFEEDNDLVVAQARFLSGRERQTILASDFE